MRRRQPDIHNGHVGPVSGDGGAQVFAVLHRGDDVVAAQGEQLGEPRTQDRRILGEHDSHNASRTAMPRLNAAAVSRR
jgi:hypothetical protein